MGPRPPVAPPAGSQGTSAGQRLIARFLADHGLPDVDAVDDNGWNAAHFAVEDLRRQAMVPDMVLRVLRLVDADLLHEPTTGGQPTGSTPLHMVASFGDQQQARAEIVREMIRLAASVNTRHVATGASPLHRAAGCGNAEVVKALLDLRANVNQRNDVDATPLDMCAGSNFQARSGGVV